MILGKQFLACPVIQVWNATEEKGWIIEQLESLPVGDQDVDDQQAPMAEHMELNLSLRQSSAVGDEA